MRLVFAAKDLTLVGRSFEFFEFSVETHHEVLAPKKNREHSIGDGLIVLNGGFMERL